MAKKDDKKYEKQFDSSTWRNILRLLYPYRWNYAVTIGVIALLAGVEVLFPLVVRHAIDNGIVAKDKTTIYHSAATYGILIIIQSTLVAIFISQCGRVGARVISDLRHKMFSRLQTLSVSYFDNTPVGWLMSRMFSDSMRVGETLTWGAVDFVWGLVNMFLMALAMIWVHWKLSVLVLAMIPFIIGVSIFFQRRILTQYRRVRQINSDITAGYSEGYSGFHVIKTLGRERAMTQEFSEITDNMFKASFHSAVLSSLYLPLIHIIGSVGSALVVGFGGSGVILNSISLGTLVAFLSYTRRFFDPAREIARVFGQLQETQASAERMFSLLAEEPHVKERPNAQDSGDVTGNVEFRKVIFGYEKKKHVLNNFSLTVKVGETIALVGPTGSGKSTVINLLMRFYDPVKGTVLIDGNDIRSWTLKKLRSNMGIILQTPHLFSGTVIENLRYGRLDATDEEIVEASKLTGLHEFIMDLPEKYDTKLKEGGEPLSTGQKQLVSMARAVLANPPIFVMDEATSNIDMETEHRIQTACEKILKGKTAFIIAHRLNTIRNADKILVINKGRIAEMGSHQDLLAQKGFYHKLFTQQFLTG